MSTVEQNTNEQNIPTLQEPEVVEEMVDTIEYGDVIGNCKWFNKKTRPPSRSP